MSDLSVQSLNIRNTSNLSSVNTEKSQDITLAKNALKNALFEKSSVEKSKGNLKNRTHDKNNLNFNLSKVVASSQRTLAKGLKVSFRLKRQCRHISNVNDGLKLLDSRSNDNDRCFIKLKLSALCLKNLQESLYGFDAKSARDLFDKGLNAILNTEDIKALGSFIEELTKLPESKALSELLNLIDIFKQDSIKNIELNKINQDNLNIKDDLMSNRSNDVYLKTNHSLTHRILSDSFKASSDKLFSLREAFYAAKDDDKKAILDKATQYLDLDNNQRIQLHELSSDDLKMDFLYITQGFKNEIAAINKKLPDINFDNLIASCLKLSHKNQEDLSTRAQIFEKLSSLLNEKVADATLGQVFADKLQPILNAMDLCNVKATTELNVIVGILSDLKSVANTHTLDNISSDSLQKFAVSLFRDNNKTISDKATLALKASFMLHQLEHNEKPSPFVKDKVVKFLDKLQQDLKTPLSLKEIMDKSPSLINRSVKLLKSASRNLFKKGGTDRLMALKNNYNTEKYQMLSQRIMQRALGVKNLALDMQFANMHYSLANAIESDRHFQNLISLNQGIIDTNVIENSNFSNLINSLNEKNFATDKLGLSFKDEIKVDSITNLQHGLESITDIDTSLAILSLERALVQHTEDLSDALLDKIGLNKANFKNNNYDLNSKLSDMAFAINNLLHMPMHEYEASVITRDFVNMASQMFEKDGITDIHASSQAKTLLVKKLTEYASNALNAQKQALEDSPLSQMQIANSIKALDHELLNCENQMYQKIDKLLSTHFLTEDESIKLLRNIAMDHRCQNFELSEVHNDLIALKSIDASKLNDKDLLTKFKKNLSLDIINRSKLVSALSSAKTDNQETIFNNSIKKVVSDKNLQESLSSLKTDLQGYLNQGKNVLRNITDGNKFNKKLISEFKKINLNGVTGQRLLFMAAAQFAAAANISLAKETLAAVMNPDFRDKMSAYMSHTLVSLGIPKSCATVICDNFINSRLFEGGIYSATVNEKIKSNLSQKALLRMSKKEGIEHVMQDMQEQQLGQRVQELLSQMQNEDGFVLEKSGRIRPVSASVAKAASLAIDLHLGEAFSIKKVNGKYNFNISHELAVSANLNLGTAARVPRKKGKELRANLEGKAFVNGSVGFSLNEKDANKLIVKLIAHTVTEDILTNADNMSATRGIGIEGSASGTFSVKATSHLIESELAASGQIVGSIKKYQTDTNWGSVSTIETQVATTKKSAIVGQVKTLAKLAKTAIKREGDFTKTKGLNIHNQEHNFHTRTYNIERDLNNKVVGISIDSHIKNSDDLMDKIYSELTNLKVSDADAKLFLKRIMFDANEKGLDIESIKVSANCNNTLPKLSLNNPFSNVKEIVNADPKHIKVEVDYSSEVAKSRNINLAKFSYHKAATHMSTQSYVIK